MNIDAQLKDRIYSQLVEIDYTLQQAEDLNTQRLNLSALVDELYTLIDIEADESQACSSRELLPGGWEGNFNDFQDSEYCIS
jgi:hypothetical protein